MDDGSEAEKELLALRKRLREVAMERDILKKAALIFDRGS
jgi:transposase-like protein